MPTSAWYQGESLKQLLQGAALGALATLAIGLSWGGWMLGSTAKTLADSTANSAVVAAIAPICVDQFQRSADAANNLTALQKTSSYEQAAYDLMVIRSGENVFAFNNARGQICRRQPRRSRCAAPMSV